ncbi:MAG: hypothetical protein LBD23_16160 [Oscillospiraceae bacterium]|jgi:hypothetical protein|nr:hypothetical protein [Oscillospiraceae bacterium]
MNKKYHILPDGSIGECKVTTGRCPYGGEHFDSPEQAQKSIDLKKEQAQKKIDEHKEQTKVTVEEADNDNNSFVVKTLKIKNNGVGGFLNPPTHPEHTMSVGDKNNHLSLSGAIQYEWVPKNIKEQAQKILDDWKKPALDSPEIVDWRRHVLGYFRNCYSKDGIDRNVNNKENMFIFNSKDKPNLPIDHHLGVMFIREFYPEYKPNNADFAGAYWGKKLEDEKTYKYITTHGIGPATLPKDINLMKSEDLPNYKTAIHLNRPLTDEEQNYFDIRSGLISQDDDEDVVTDYIKSNPTANDDNLYQNAQIWNDEQKQEKSISRYHKEEAKVLARGNKW